MTAIDCLIHDKRPMQTIKRLTPENQAPINASPWGETPLPFAPTIRLKHGKATVPQQYLMVERNLENVEAILQDIEFSDHYILFAGNENANIYLQVGIIGCENYPYNQQQSKENKIVYGRRWLIEPSTPTSEVVQTALLALKKAREHELRENVYIMLENNIKTTPFNTHMDLPLMKNNSEFFEIDNDANSNKKTVDSVMQSVLSCFKLKSFVIKLDSITEIVGDKFLIQLKLHSTCEDVHFPEFKNCSLSILCSEVTESSLIQQLMDELVRISDRYVDNQFSFNGFARFSNTVCPLKIAEFSYQTRNIKHKDPRFVKYFKQMSYEVDSSKAPTYATGELGDKQRYSIEKNRVMSGYLPNDPNQAELIAI